MRLDRNKSFVYTIFCFSFVSFLLAITIFAEDCAFRIGLYPTGHLSTLKATDTYTVLTPEILGFLFFLDVSNPYSPSIRGELYLPYRVNDAVSRSTYTYLALSNGRIAVINTLPDASPVLVTIVDTGSYVHDLEIKDNHLYACTIADGFQVFDLHNPIPELIVRDVAGGAAYSMAFMENYIYLAAGDQGIKILELQDPTNPSVVGSYNIPGSTREVVIIENYLYVLDYDGILTILELLYPTLPSEQTTIDLMMSKATMVRGDNLLAVLGETGRTDIYDLEAPEAPSLAHSMYISNHTASIAFEGYYLYEASDEQGLTVMDLSDPSDPIEIDRLMSAESIDYMDENADLLVTISNRGTTNNPSFIMKIFDPMDYYRHDPISSYSMNVDTIYAMDVKQDGIYLIVESDNVQSLLVIDIQDTHNPAEKSRGTIHGYIRNIVVEEPYLYVNSSSGFAIYDISDPELPISLSTLTTPIYRSDIFYENGIIYSPDYYDRRVGAIDVSDPSQPQYLFTLTGPSSVESIAAYENLLVISWLRDGLEFFDVTNYYPISLSAFHEGHTYSDFSIRGEYILSATELSGFVLIDIHDLSSPSIAQSISTYTPSDSIHVGDGWVILINEDQGYCHIDTGNCDFGEDVVKGRSHNRPFQGP